MNIDTWNNLVKNAKTEFGFAELGVLALTRDIREQISAKFAESDVSAFPKYLTESLEMRSDPMKLFPWAKSVIVVAFPFADIPDQKPFLKPAASLETSGKVAGYAMKMDYHIFGKKLLAEFAEKLKNELNCKIYPSSGAVRTEICIDTSPVAEKILANLAGIGSIGLNSCSLVKNHGSGCFLGEIFIDFPVSGFRCQVSGETELSESSEEFWSCQGCNRCLASCPTGAILEGKEFRCELCRSHLTMEKRGEFTKEERQLLGDWVFGCDICTECCPRSNIPPAFDVNLEWLLMTPSGELKKTVKGTALDYAGVTLLQRNALAVLENRNTSASLDLIKKFAEKTGSDLLKKTAEDILSGF
jgi:epoxyqueuosine reductase